MNRKKRMTSKLRLRSYIHVVSPPETLSLRPAIVESGMRTAVDDKPAAINENNIPVLSSV